MRDPAPRHPLPDHPLIPDDTDLGVNSLERRYRVHDDAEGRKFMGELISHLARLAKRHTYHTTTLYLDKPSGGWMDGTTKVKYRFRNYDGDRDSQGRQIWFLEQKCHKGDKTYKRRVKLTWDDLARLKPLVPQFADQYTRWEYEFRGIRVTIDTHVKALDKHMKAHATLDEYIIEVKRAPNVPDWLLDMLKPYETDKSKSKWIRKELGISA